MDITETLAPKSDQLNADDLISGPKTIVVTDVTKGSAEQPVNIHWQGGDGRPFKPSKSMRRIIAQAWGVESKDYAGRSMTLYRDPGVKYAGQDVGGIRISHISHIDKPMKTAITLARGKREACTVQVIVDRDFVSEGNDVALNGIDALKSWWKTVPGDEQAKLKDMLENEWKIKAGGVK